MNDSSEKILNSVSKCNRCGFCNAVCPVFRATQIESMGPRGRNIITKGLLEGEITSNDDIKKNIYNCLLCKACEKACYPGISTDEIMVAQRSIFRGNSKHQFFYHALNNHKNMGWFIKLISTTKNLWSSKTLNSILSKISPYPKTANMFNLNIPAKSLRETLQNIEMLPKKRMIGKVGYFVGCAINFMMPETGLSTINLMLEAGYGVKVINNGCCGLLPYTYGYTDSARRLALKNENLIMDSSFDMVVTDCASCASFLTEYEKMNINIPNTRIIDITRFLENTKFKTEWNKVVTYHDPCHLKRYLGVHKEPRNLIKQVAEFKEMDNADLCCGGAGTYGIREESLSNAIQDQKSQNIIKSKADILVTSCPSCIIHLQKGLNSKNNNKIDIMHISDFLAKDLKKS